MKTNKSFSKNAILYCSLTLILASCNQGNITDLQVYVTDIESRKHAHIKPLPPPSEYEAYAYKENNLRNPFNPGAQKGPENPDTCPNSVHERDALEEFPLESLAMVGSLQLSGKRWALISTQDGTIHRRKTYDYVGNNNGQITKITEKSMELLELISDRTIGCIKRVTILTLNE